MELVIYIIVVALSAIFHEYMHGWVAYQMGDPTAKYEGRLTLNPLAHIDPFYTLLLPLITYFIGGFVIAAAKPVPFNPYNLRYQKWGPAIVGVVGPLSNVFIALVFTAFLRLGMLGPGFSTLFIIVIIVNVGLAVFNLIPIPPLDGSRLLMALSPSGVRQMLEQMEMYGLLVIFLFVYLLSPAVSRIVLGISSFLIGPAF